jgi:hypothetical protein
MAEEYAGKLRLAPEIMWQLTRIGYPSEGIRLTFFTQVPYTFSVEIQLSAKDTERLIKALTQKLAEEKKRGLR